MDFSSYLTKDERQQMEELMRKATERKKQEEEKTDVSVSCMFWQMQYESGKQTDDETARRKADYEKDLRGLVDQVCGFFQRHGYCDICRGHKADIGEDEELPFD